ncbi:pentapeptide repeat-containing protein [Nostocaceae cyanobacterium CENA357]|uniref:Pentapeptide repeat-containing protein n=1 Tax=Atlanticothrix silvestris CENA357 TaxID=1725252 RepID=A0A8J7HIJ9_9CYAN|nr:pentapeptide repeat-containing protein [Atlanticothrix silvestris CENA357]
MELTNNYNTPNSKNSNPTSNGKNNSQSFIIIFLIIAVSLAIFIFYGWFLFQFLNDLFNLKKVEFLFSFIIVLIACTQGLYVGKQAIEADKRYISVRDIGYLLSRFVESTSFRQANLTEANFTEAELKNTDFRGANIKHVDWTGSENINLAHIGRSYLQYRQILNLVVSRKAKDKNEK